MQHQDHTDNDEMWQGPDVESLCVFMAKVFFGWMGVGETGFLFNVTYSFKRLLSFVTPGQLLIAYLSPSLSTYIYIYISPSLSLSFPSTD